MQVFDIANLMSVIWIMIGCSIALCDGNTWWGGHGKLFFASIPVDMLSGAIPENVFFIFRMTFAIITSALIVGVYLERIKFNSMFWFRGLSLIFAYAPPTHYI